VTRARAAAAGRWGIDPGYLPALRLDRKTVQRFARAATVDELPTKWRTQVTWG
jgi:hypothetical protein